MKLKLFLYINLLYLFNSSFSNHSTDNSLSSFNEYLTVESTPIVQLQFIYSLLSNYIQTSMSGLETTGGVIGQGTGMAFISTNGEPGAKALLASKARINYQPGQGANAVFSAIFEAGVPGNRQYIGIGNASDGFFFGYNEMNFGLLYRNNYNDTWISQNNWNQDKLDGLGKSGLTLNPLFGNVYKIQYQWLGFGIIKFFVKNPDNGLWILVHLIDYSAATAPNISNPSMQLLAANMNNTGSSANVTMKTSSMAGFIEGQLASSNLYSNFSIFTTGSIDSQQRTFLSIKNNELYQGLNNQSMIVLDSLSILNGASNTGTYVATLFKNPSVSGASYTSVASNSVVSYDTSKTGVSGSEMLLFAYLSNNKNFGQKGLDIINLSNKKILIAPGDRLVIALNSIAGGTLNPVGVALSWYEKQ